MPKIVTVPNPLLRTKSKPLRPADRKTAKLLAQIEAFLTQGERARGVGLSAVQIGRPVRLFALYLSPSGNPDDEQNLELQFFLNPEIINSSDEQSLGPDPKKPVLEGCLSVPHIWGPVYRHQWILLKWQTVGGDLKQQKFAGFPARVIQHEYDHLEGILFTDHSLKDKLPLYQSQGNKLVALELPHTR